ncbi:hypothetical protein WN943_006175 [Citrus x changshan-huyou]
MAGLSPSFTTSLFKSVVSAAAAAHPSRTFTAGISSPLLLLLILHESDLPPLLIADSRPRCHCHLPLSPTINCCCCHGAPLLPSDCCCELLLVTAVFAELFDLVNGII